MSDGFETVFTYINNVVSATTIAWAAEFNYMRDVAVAVWEAIKHPFSKGFDPPDTEPYKQALNNLASAWAGKDASITKQTEAALNARTELEKAHATRIKELSAEHMAAEAAQQSARTANAQATSQAIVGTEQAAANSIVAAYRFTTDELAKEHAKRLAASRKVAREIIAAQQSAMSAASSSSVRGGSFVSDATESLGSSTSASNSVTTNDQGAVLQELKGIRSDNQKLLRFG